MNNVFLYYISDVVEATLGRPPVSTYRKVTGRKRDSAREAADVGDLNAPVVDEGDIPEDRKRDAIFTKSRTSADSVDDDRLVERGWGNRPWRRL